MKYIQRFSELSIDDVSIVGSKNASLGEMYNTLAEQGINVPNGFATTAEAYYFYLQHNKLDQRIKETLDVLDSRNLDSLRNAGKTLRGWIMNSDMPAQLHRGFAHRIFCRTAGILS
jgi:pyruvate,water dikinase